jgi:ankyrin repeat protein
VQKDFKNNRSVSSAPYLYSYMPNPIQKYFFGVHAKTKRTLAEEAECGDEISVCSWIREGCDPNEEDHYGYTPLLNAAALGRVNAVHQLIKNNADVNKPGPFGFTPLHAAAQVRNHILNK